MGGIIKLITGEIFYADKVVALINDTLLIKGSQPEKTIPIKDISFISHGVCVDKEISRRLQSVVV